VPTDDPFVAFECRGRPAALSGGGQFTVNGKAALHDSYPTGGGTTGTWVVNFVGTGPGTSGNTTLQSYVICSGP
jgi:hypothetical protein